MMIIVEGPDNSGKSTLINQLGKDFGIKLIEPVSHGPVKGFKDLYDRTNGLIKRAISNHTNKIIVDRISLISEPIYGTICRNKNLWKLSPKDEEKFWKVLDILDCIYIYCRPDDNIVLSMRTHQIKDYDTPVHLKALKENQQRIVEAYDKYFSSFTRPYFKYNYNKESSYRDLTNFIKEHIKW